MLGLNVAFKLTGSAFLCSTEPPLGDPASVLRKRPEANLIEAGSLETAFHSPSAISRFRVTTLRSTLPTCFFAATPAPAEPVRL
jgi:hypothetical protein